ALAAGAGKVVVVDNPKRRLEDHLPEGVVTAIQEQPNGTGDAVASAGEHLEGTVLIINGDVPLITPETRSALGEGRESSGAAGTVVSMELDDPSGYGRIVRDSNGDFETIVETKVEGDASEAELAIREVNTGVYAFEGASLLGALSEIDAANAQGELYLTDVLPELRD